MIRSDDPSAPHIVAAAARVAAADVVGAPRPARARRRRPERLVAQRPPRDRRRVAVVLGAPQTDVDGHVVRRRRQGGPQARRDDGFRVPGAGAVVAPEALVAGLAGEGVGAGREDGVGDGPGGIVGGAG